MFNLKPPIGLIAAMSQESQAILRFAKDERYFKLGQLPFFTFLLAGQACVLVTSGMGVKRAADAARKLVENYAPGVIISFGIAGALEADLDIGEIVLPQAYCQWGGTSATALIPLASWPAEALDAAAHALAGRGKRVLTGTAITAKSSRVRQDQLGDLTHPVLEMETAGIAHVAAKHGIPLLSLRSISDGPRAPIPLDLDEVMDDDANLRVVKLMGYVLRNPGIVQQGVRIIRNSVLAAENAALVLAAVLSQPDFLKNYGDPNG